MHHHQAAAEAHPVRARPDAAVRDSHRLLPTSLQKSREHIPPDANRPQAFAPLAFRRIAIAASVTKVSEIDVQAHGDYVLTDSYRLISSV